MGDAIDARGLNVPVRTLVSAPGAATRAALAAALERDARIDVVGEAAPHELAALALATEPDVVVEQRDGPSEGAAYPTVALVDDPRATLAADGFASRGRGSALLSRDASAEELVAAVVAVAAGLVAVQPRALGFASEALPSLERALPSERLSPREIEVLAELARGSANKQIAARLGISEHTVKFHVASIFGKLGVASRTEAVTAGVRRGLIML